MASFTAYLIATVEASSMCGYPGLAIDFDFYDNPKPPFEKCYTNGTFDRRPLVQIIIFQAISNISYQDAKNKCAAHAGSFIEARRSKGASEWK